MSKNQDNKDWANSGQVNFGEKINEFEREAEMLGDAWRWFAVQPYGQTVMKWMDRELSKPCGCQSNPTATSYYAGLSDALKIIRNLMTIKQ